MNNKQLEQAAIEYAADTLNYESSKLAFIAGAEWQKAHEQKPVDDGAEFAEALEDYDKQFEEAQEQKPDR